MEIDHHVLYRNRYLIHIFVRLPAFQGDIQQQRQKLHPVFRNFIQDFKPAFVQQSFHVLAVSGIQALL